MDYQNMEYFIPHKEQVIDLWVESLNTRYPGLYDLQQLKTTGSDYFHMICDIHIPITQHPLFAHTEEWCHALFKKEIPIDHILMSSQLFRESFIKMILHNGYESAESFKVMAKLSERINIYEIEVCKYYWTNARLLLDDQDRMIDEFHDDKLNLIGKMASSMAHEIRNPLTSIKGFIKLIRSSLPHDSFKRVESYLDIIDSEFQNIHMQITGLLSFSKKLEYCEFMTGMVKMGRPLALPTAKRFRQTA